MGTLGLLHFHGNFRRLLQMKQKFNSYQKQTSILLLAFISQLSNDLSDKPLKSDLQKTTVQQVNSGTWFPQNIPLTLNFNN